MEVLGAVGKIIGGILNLLVSVVVNLIATLLFDIAGAIIEAMHISPSDVTSMLDKIFTSRDEQIGQFITFLGFSIAIVIAFFELLKGLTSVLTGAENAMRPGTVAVRSLLFGAWTIAGIPFSQMIWNAGYMIYDGLYTTAKKSTKTEMQLIGFAGDMWDAFGKFADGLTDLTPDITAGETQTTSLLGEILIPVFSTVLFSIIIWNFIKLLLECATRFASIVFLTYLSPLCIAFGVSPSQSKITWSWFRALLSSLMLWIINVWAVYGGLSVLSHCEFDSGAMLSWALFAFGYMKAAQQIDNLAGTLGATVTSASGSLIADFYGMNQAKQLVRNKVEGLGNVVNGAITAATGGAGATGAAEAAAAGTSVGSDANGMHRTGKQIAKDAVIGGFKQTKTGQAISGIHGGIKNIANAFRSANKERAERKMDDKYIDTAEKLEEIQNRNAQEAAEKKKEVTEGGIPGDEKRASIDAEYAEKTRQEMADVMHNASAEGIGELGARAAVRARSAKNTLYDANHPELGTMADHGLQCAKYHVGNNGGVTATYEKRDENGNLIESRTLGDVGSTHIDGNSENNPLRDGMTAKKPPKAVVGGVLKESMRMNAVSNNPSEVADVQGTGPNGKGNHNAFRFSVAASKSKNEDGTQDYNITRYDTAGKATEAYTVTAKKGVTTQQMAEALAKGEEESLIAKTPGNKKTGEEPSLRMTEPQPVTGMAASTLKGYQPTYMNEQTKSFGNPGLDKAASKVAAAGPHSTAAVNNAMNTVGRLRKPPERATVDGKDVGLTAGVMYALSSYSNKDTGETFLTFSNPKNGKVERHSCVPTADFEQALKSPKDLKNLIGKLPPNGEQTGEHEGYRNIPLAPAPEMAGDASAANSAATAQATATADTTKPANSGPAQNNTTAQNQGSAHGSGAGDTARPADSGPAQSNTTAQNQGSAHGSGAGDTARPANSGPAQNNTTAQNQGPAHGSGAGDTARPADSGPAQNNTTVQNQGSVRVSGTENTTQSAGSSSQSAGSSSAQNSTATRNQGSDSTPDTSDSTQQNTAAAVAEAQEKPAKEPPKAERRSYNRHPQNGQKDKSNQKGKPVKNNNRGSQSNRNRKPKRKK